MTLSVGVSGAPMTMMDSGALHSLAMLSEFFARTRHCMVPEGSVPAGIVAVVAAELALAMVFQSPDAV